MTDPYSLSIDIIVGVVMELVCKGVDISLSLSLSATQVKAKYTSGPSLLREVPLGRRVDQRKTMAIYICGTRFDDFLRLSIAVSQRISYRLSHETIRG
jgi:hypothetical protein